MINPLPAFIKTYPDDQNVDELLLSGTLYRYKWNKKYGMNNATRAALFNEIVDKRLRL